MPINEHGHQVDEGWTPGSPVLEGKTQVPDQISYLTHGLDELPHRERWQRGLADDLPDPGYDPDADDLDVPL